MFLYLARFQLMYGLMNIMQICLHASRLASSAVEGSFFFVAIWKVTQRVSVFIRRDANAYLIKEICGHFSLSLGRLSTNLKFRSE